MVGQSTLDAFLDMTDEMLGDIIEEVIEEYYEDKIDIEAEYEDILNYIVKRLIKKTRGKSDAEKYLKILRNLRRRASIAKLVISYLVSQYIEERDTGRLEPTSQSEEGV
ncbi:hypothetical protein ACSU1N_01470 [Thermogladius sp. 4427co]|uniref:hypothetical protein n=1 Tax=Thermogladius sp. 4427co TaxID=3450718 RepID=UPI003F7AFF5C